MVSSALAIMIVRSGMDCSKYDKRSRGNSNGVGSVAGVLLLLPSRVFGIAVVVLSTMIR